MNDAPSFYDLTLFGVALWRLGLALLFLVAGVALRKIMGRGLRTLVERVTARTTTELDDRIGAAVEPPLRFAPVALGVFLAAQTLQLQGLAFEISLTVAETLLAITVFWALARLVDPLVYALRGADRLLTPELTHWVYKLLRGGVWAVGGATILELWGVRVLPIIAGFGLLGVAVALGAQDLFKNLISGVLILTERRFRAGDWVKVDGVVEGTVEAIGFRSTKVRRFDKAPVYVPNAVFANDAVVNFGEMTHRRIFWRIGLEYRATAGQLRRVRDRVEALIAEDARYLAPPAATRLIRIDQFSDSSIDLMIYCFTETRDWAEWLAIKEELVLAVKTIVEEEGAGFAFPSRSLYIEETPGRGGGEDGARLSSAVAAVQTETGGAAVASPGPSASATPSADDGPDTTPKAAAKKPSSPKASSPKASAARRTTAKAAGAKPTTAKPAAPRRSTRKKPAAEPVS